MIPRPKQPVIDKDVFVAYMGKEFGALCNFVQNHFLLLSDTLLYECMTAGRPGPKVLLGGFETLMKAGAYYCSGSRRFVEWECGHCRPYPWLLADFEETANVRTGKRSVRDLLAPQVTQAARDKRYDLADVMLLAQSKELRDAKDPNVTTAFKVLPPDRSRRLHRIEHEAWLNVRGWALMYYARWIVDSTRFCPSPEWVTWHDIHLRWVLRVEYAYLGQTCGIPDLRCAEHDYQDMEYVLLLSRADGIITRDKRLVEPLARAAFPEKDVFSSLEEVSQSYRCDRAGD